MHPLQIQHLSDDLILSLARDILKPYACAWGTCTMVLNSWRSYEKHMHLHCQQEIRSNPIHGRCRWLSCSGFAFSSDRDLIEHVNLSHLNQLPLHCPFKDCSDAFSNGQALSDHFFRVHQSFQNSSPVDLFIPYSRRSTHLFTPPKEDLPPLPVKPVLCTYLNETCCALRISPRAAINAPSQSRKVVGRGQKRRRGKLMDGGARRVRSKPEAGTDGESKDELDGVGEIRRGHPKSTRLNRGTTSKYLVWRSKAKSWARIEKELGEPPVPDLRSEPSLKVPPMSFGFDKLKESARL